MYHNELANKIAMKINDLADVIEISGKVWQQTKNEKDLRFVCSRVVAKNKLQAYLQNLI